MTRVAEVSKVSSKDRRKGALDGRPSCISYYKKKREVDAGFLLLEVDQVERCEIIKKWMIKDHHPSFPKNSIPVLDLSKSFQIQFFEFLSNSVSISNLPRNNPSLLSGVLIILPLLFFQIQDFIKEKEGGVGLQRIYRERIYL